MKHGLHSSNSALQSPPGKFCVKMNPKRLGRCGMRLQISALHVPPSALHKSLPQVPEVQTCTELVYPRACLCADPFPQTPLPVWSRTFFTAHIFICPHGQDLKLSPHISTLVITSSVDVSYGKMFSKAGYASRSTVQCQIQSQQNKKVGRGRRPSG